MITQLMTALEESKRSQQAEERKEMGLKEEELPLETESENTSPSKMCCFSMILKCLLYYCHSHTSYEAWPRDLGLLNKNLPGRSSMADKQCQLGSVKPLDSFWYWNWKGWGGPFWDVPMGTLHLKVPPFLHHLPHGSRHPPWCCKALLIRGALSSAWPVWLGRAQLLLSSSRTSTKAFPSMGMTSLIRFPDRLSAWSGATRLTFHPLDSHLIIRFSPLLLNGRLGGRDCFGWNLTRPRWFYQLQVLSFLLAAHQLLVFSQFFQGWRRRGRKGQ